MTGLSSGIPSGDALGVTRRALPESAVVWTSAAAAPAGGLTITLSPGLEAFSGLTAVLQAVAEHLGESVPDVLRGHETAAELTVPELLGVAPQRRGHFYNADNVGSSVIRRISRESIHLTDAVDDLARLLIDLAARVDDPWTILAAEHLDRPTARVLYRAHQLDDDHALRWVWGFTANPLARAGAGELTIERRYRDSRARLFSVLAERTGAVIDDPVSELPGIDMVPVGDPGRLVTLVSQALVDQNYDRAYTAAVVGLESLPPADRCNVWRMLCIADANMGRIDDAAHSIAEARAAADDPWLVSQCLYMHGLLETKRRYDLDAAEDAYREALDLLADCDADDPRTRVERAWATNGLALVRTLRTKQLEPEERDRELMRIFVDEAEVFQGVHDQMSAPALYLQLNLLANMALLLEVKGDFDKAASFWSRAFEKFRGTSDADRRGFEVAFLYRLGLLQLKAGAVDDARASMDRALEVPDVATRAFTLDRLLYGKGHVELVAGDAAAAAATFATGCALALRLRHDESLGDHLAGLEEASATATHPELAHWRGVAADRGVEVRSPRRAPAPKFPSYVPLVDLEVAPTIDLNRFLANDRSGQSLDGALGRTS